ncbi:ABC transporter permease [Luteimonas deserti]|uniref:ABC transporter permease n=1 Tax=Luteimonas deserti TaxID=2752306 RepID=A0A7Z0QTB2_9GAMM|nr:ABC transporter permease [Luteimonas deserti]NYZ63556.1 ABC transporter permease [Luteimonas deserti]
MFGYYLQLALRSFRNSKVLTALMVLAIALGIGACMTTLTVFRVLSGDPIPEKSDRLFYVQLDPRTARGASPGEDPETQVTRFDAETLLREAKGLRQAMMTGGSVSVTPERADLPPFFSPARYTSRDFFAMFDVPFEHGAGWSAEDDAGSARVAVITKSLNERVFGGVDSVGRTLMIGGNEFRVAGVLDTWRPTPRFWDMFSQTFGDGEDIFLPFSTSRALSMGRSGNMNCWNTTADDTGLNAPCVWIQYWVELETPAQAADFKAYLDNYSAQQKAAGRYERDPNTRLSNVMEWLTYNRVVPRDVVMQLWLGFGFLLVCLLNTVGLLLAKFLRRSGEIGVRRALGASRRDIFMQCLVEAGTIGVAGGVLGLGLSLLGLWGVRQQPASYAGLAHLDVPMLLTTFALAVTASLLAGVLPAWRAMQITPAIQLKTQ